MISSYALLPSDHTVWFPLVYPTKMSTRLAVFLHTYLSIYYHYYDFFKATVAEIMIYCRGSQADMSPLSTIAAITLPWSIVLHDSLQKGPILHPLPIHLILLHFQASLPPCLIYSILFLVLLYLLCPSLPPFHSSHISICFSTIILLLYFSTLNSSSIYSFFTPSLLPLSHPFPYIS